MNFVWLVQLVAEMYADGVGWRPPISVSADWSCPRTDTGGNLQVAVRDALIKLIFQQENSAHFYLL